MATTPTPPQQSSDLQDLIGPIWRRKWLLLAIVVTSTVGTYVASSRQAEQYRSTAQVFVSSSEIESIVAGGAAAGNQRSTLDQAKLIVSKPVAERVVKALGLPDSPEGLMGSVTAAPVDVSSFVAITAVRGSGAEAAAIANGFADEYFRVRSEQLRKEAASAVVQLRAQLNAIPVRLSTAEQRRALQATIRQLQVLQAATPEQRRQTDPARAGAPFAPTPRRDATFAFAISLGLCLALALALERFDRRVRSVEDIATVFGVPLLSALPQTTTPPAETHDGKAAVPDALREPFRALRTNLQLASLDKPIRRIVVASAISGEGKSTVVRNMALTYREWGMSVAVLEADLRRPTLSAAFGVEGHESGGLTSVLTGDCALDDALVDVVFDIASLEYLDKVRESDRRRADATATTASSQLVLLPSGDTPPNPQAVLAADRTREIIDQLSERFDIVVIDTPPLLAVSDAIPLLPQADGVVFVGRVGVSERAAAQRAIAAARLDPRVRILGVVANGLAFLPGAGYGYGYGYSDYGHAYGSDRSNGKKSKS